MLNLQFTPYRTEIREGLLDLTPVTEGAPDRDYWMIPSGQPQAVNVADGEGFGRIVSQVETWKDTPEGRTRQRRFFSFVRNVPAEELGKTICERCQRDERTVPVMLEPMSHSIRVTLLPPNEDAPS